MKQVYKELNISMNDMIVRIVLCDVRLGDEVEQNKSKLTKIHIKVRLEFAKCHRNETITNWEHIVFFDETKLNRF